MTATYQEIAHILENDLDCDKISSIGNGAYRMVFTHEDHPGVVFKLERDIIYGCNESEYLYYTELMTPEQRLHCAKPLWISDNNMVMVMERVQGTLMDNRLDCYGRRFHFIKMWFYELFDGGVSDLHGGNIMWDEKQRKVKLVDFG